MSKFTQRAAGRPWRNSTGLDKGENMTIEQLRWAAAVNLDRQERKTMDIKAIERISLTIIICSVVLIAVALLLN